MTRPLVIAHRGASGECPENTLPAFERAIEESADMIETDLHLSRDRVVVIHHDASLERLGAAGEIRDRTAAELRMLNAAPGASIAEAMPTFLDLLEGFGERMEFNLELKIGVEAPYEGLEEIVIEELEARGLISRMLLSCFEDGVLERLRARSAAARLAVLASPRAPAAIVERATRVGAEAINPHCFLVDRDLVGSAHALGLAVYPYTANELPEMTRLLDCGVDGVITNYPKRLRELVEARGKT
ncbi:MAG: glycerophosphodiester phosphodiesterase [bacterium]|nr:glycerophosphodiester phosphodiesterase [bacterium]